MKSPRPGPLAIGASSFVIAVSILLAWSRAGGAVAAPSVRVAASGLPTARNVDHVGFSVPDLDQAVAFFTDVLGAQVLMTGGPWSDPQGGSFARVLGVDRAASIKVAMLRLGPVTSIELVQFTAPGQHRQMPKASDWGAAHLALFVDDIDAAVARLKARGVEVLEGPVTNGPGPIAGSRYIYFLSPWGMPMELEERHGPLPYEAAGRHPYGPAPSWSWRPAGENGSEVSLLQTLTPTQAGEVAGALTKAERAVRSLPGTYEYRWLRSAAPAAPLRGVGRFADAASADAAIRAAAVGLARAGKLTSETLAPAAQLQP